jgi:hypothetical protein
VLHVCTPAYRRTTGRWFCCAWSMINRSCYFHLKSKDDKVKVKLSLRLTKHHEMKMYWSGGIAPRILDLGTRWRWVVSFTTQPLCPQGKRPWYPLDRRLGGPQSRSGRGGEEKIPQCLPALELRTPIIQPVTCCFTDWATRALKIKAVRLNLYSLIEYSLDVVLWYTNWKSICSPPVTLYYHRLGPFPDPIHISFWKMNPFRLSFGKKPHSSIDSS